MADENYSSLREAVSRIIGAPPGGAPQQADQTVALAPKASYSQQVQTPTTTTAAISNTPFDPFAEQNAANAASLASITAQNDQLAAQVAPSVVAAPAVATSADTYKAAALKAGYDEDKWRASFAQARVDPKAMEDIIMIQKSQLGVLPKITGDMSESQIRSTMGGYGAPQKNIDATVKMWHPTSSAGPTTIAGQRNQRYAVAKTPEGRPINPGARAPWQASQQYWKDLAAYKGT